MGASFSISASALSSRLGTPDAPVVIDVRRRELIEQSGRLVPSAQTRNAYEAPAWAATLDPARAHAIICAHGHERSQYAAATLRERGLTAFTIENGYDGWDEAGLPFVTRTAAGATLGDQPTSWVTRRRPKIDRVACPWLISRFLDARARFLFVDPDYVLLTAEATGAIPYDLPGAALEHDGPLCTFDTILRAFGLDRDPSLAALAEIVRGADTDRLDLAPQAAGLLAMSLGLSALAGDDDHVMLAKGFTLYDGLFAWIRQARGESHNWPRAAKQ